MKVELYRVFISLTAVVVILLCLPQKTVGQRKHNGVKTIMIDPGHGGHDPGTVYNEFKEKDINLSVALLLGEMITKNLPDVKVHYTRKTDVFVDLYKRGDMANKASADLFISLHVNSVPKGKTAPSGTETFVLGPSKSKANLDVAMKENDVIVFEEDYTTNYEGYTPGSPESFIIFSLMQYVNMDQSMNLANIMQQHYKTSLGIHDRGAKQNGFLVLWKTAMPAVLTEMGFISNEQDRKMLTSAAGQKKIATALFNAISEYKSRVEGNTQTIKLKVDDSESSTASIQNNEVRTGKNIVYRIQVCSSARKLGFNGAQLKKYKDMGITEVQAGSSYKYCVGECSSYSEAAELQKKVRKTTPDAFMVAFADGKNISVAEARKLTD